MEGFKITVIADFDFGEIVYLKTCTDSVPRQVTGYVLRPGNIILYRLACLGEETVHYPFEIVREPVKHPETL